MNAARRGDAVRVLALLVLLLCGGAAIAHACAVFEGTRWYFLDDDQLISMRYARQLAEGHGLTWNAGERVEGYTNFLWVIVMAALHALPLAAPHVPLAVMLVDLALAALLVLATGRLVARLVPEAPGSTGAGAAMLAAAVSIDVLFWAVGGFETTLFALLFAWGTGALLDGEGGTRARPAALAALALLPLVRADGLVAWSGLALAATFLAPRAYRPARLAATLLPALAHLGFRWLYYGALLPNTYYLKLQGVDDRLVPGLRYLAHAGIAYAAAAALAVFALRERRARALVLAVAPSIAYTVFAGGDNFPHARFLAHGVPLLLALAGATIATLPWRPLARAAIATGLVAGLLAVQGLPLPARLESTNGGPRRGLVAGLLVARHTAPSASVAVIAAGAVPYYSRRPALDLLGKCDPDLARGPQRRGFQPGHGKLDPERTLARRPDLVAGLIGLERVRWFLAHPGAAEATFDYNGVVATSPTFVRDYAPHPVPVEALTDGGTLFVRGDSPEVARLALWKEP